MFKINEYNLPDLKILQGKPRNELFVWRPEETIIVLGRANDSSEALTDKALADRIKIVKRPSGGETVVLSSNMLALAVLLPLKKGLKVQYYFEAVNYVIINTLEELGIKNITQKGISDLSIGEKKILGSSIYKKQDAVFYHAVLNVSEDTGIISKYLKHPKREPDYRQGREHGEFVTSLFESGLETDINKVMKLLENKEITLP